MFIGKYFSKSLLLLIILRSNIITTNKNRIEMAPTYIIRKTRAKKSRSKIIRRPNETKKFKTKNNTE